MRRRYIITGKYFPPGFDYEKEWKRARVLFVLGVGCSVQFFFRLYYAVQDLYQYQFDQKKLKWVRVLWEGAVAKSFPDLLKGQWKYYLPYFLFLVAMIFNHYLYYYSTEKCIYLMKRLPKRWTLLKSCVRFPFFGICAGAAGLAVLYLLYYIVYLIVIPGDCLRGQ